MLKLTEEQLSLAVSRAREVISLERSLYCELGDRPPLFFSKSVDLHGVQLSVPLEVLRAQAKAVIARHHKWFADIGIELAPEFIDPVIFSGRMGALNAPPSTVTAR